MIPKEIIIRTQDDLEEEIDLPRWDKYTFTTKKRNIEHITKIVRPFLVSGYDLGAKIVGKKLAPIEPGCVRLYGLHKMHIDQSDNIKKLKSKEFEFGFISDMSTIKKTNPTGEVHYFLKWYETKAKNPELFRMVLFYEQDETNNPIQTHTYYAGIQCAQIPTSM
jgi:hypothetical protein